mgnify:CR=1 FL=1
MTLLSEEEYRIANEAALGSPYEPAVEALLRAQLAKVVAEIEGLGVPAELNEAEWRDFGYSVCGWLEAARKEAG